jgi:hypothetical protein
VHIEERCCVSRDENSDGELVEQDDEDTHEEEGSGCVIG